MLEYTENSYVVANAPEKLLEKYKNVESNNDNGVAKVIDMFIWCYVFQQIYLFVLYIGWFIMLLMPEIAVTKKMTKLTIAWQLKLDYIYKEFLIMSRGFEKKVKPKKCNYV